MEARIFEPIKQRQLSSTEKLDSIPGRNTRRDVDVDLVRREKVIAVRIM